MRDSRRELNAAQTELRIKAVASVSVADRPYLDNGALQPVLAPRWQRFRGDFSITHARVPA